MFPVLKLVYTICSLVYTYSFSPIFYLYFYLFVAFWYLYALILYIYLYLCTFCPLFVPFWYLYALSSWCYIMFSLCFLHYIAKNTEKLLKFFSKNLKKISKKVLTYKRRYGNIRHVKRKDVKTDRQTQAG